MSRSRILCVIVLMGLIFFSGCIIQESVQTTVAPTPTVTSLPPVTTSAVIKIEEDGGAKVGDTVTVDYTGMLEDGAVFDTSEQNIALDSSVPKIAGFMFRESYDPLPFKLGAGEVISGFEEAVVGMKVGDVKQVTLPPEKAYGALTEDLITYSSRSFTRSRYENITRGNLRERTGVDYPVKGEQIALTDNFWGDSLKRWDNATIYDVNFKQGNVTLYHEPVQGSIVETPIGIIQISVDADTITQTLTPEINKTVYTNSGGFITVLGYDGQQIKIGHTLAGKTLVFTIKLEKIF